MSECPICHGPCLESDLQAPEEEPTERRLDGYKLFVQTEGENVVIHAVTDERPVTRLVHELDADMAWEFGQDVCDAAYRALRPKTTP